MIDLFGKLNKLSWSFVGNAVFALSQWALVTIIARFGTSEDLGIYSIALALTAPLVLFFNFQLRVILATDTQREINFSQYLGGRIIHLTFSYIIIIPIALIYGQDVKTTLVILVIGLVKYIESLSDIIMGYFQKVSRIELIGKSQILRGVYTVVLVGGIYILTNNILLSTVGMLVVMVTRFYLFDIKKVKKYTTVKPVFDKSVARLAKLGFPLGVTSLIVSLNTNIPRYLLDYFMGADFVGVFSALYYILIAGNMVITPISLLAAPKIAFAYNSDKKKFVRVIFTLVMSGTFVFFIIFLPVYFKSELILSLVYGHEYSVYGDSFILITSSLFFSIVNSFFNLAIISARRLAIKPFLDFLVMLITLTVGFYFINTYGLVGAALTLLISRVFQTLSNVVILIFIIKRKHTLTKGEFK